MATKTSWKRAERQVAAALGTRRDTFAFARGDVIHDSLAIDVKRRLRYTLNEARTDLAKLAGANPGKTPIVAAVDIPGRGYKTAATLVVMRLEDFAELFAIEAVVIAHPPFGECGCATLEQHNRG